MEVRRRDFESSLQDLEVGVRRVPPDFVRHRRRFVTERVSRDTVVPLTEESRRRVLLMGFSICIVVPCQNDKR